MRLVHSILTALFPPQVEPIADLLIGRSAAVRGRVVARDLIASPLTDEACVYYSYSIEEWHEARIAGVPEGYWRMTEHDEAIAEFYLHDASARAVVAPHYVRVERARGVAPQRIDLGTSRRRAMQLLICPGDAIQVNAVADRIDDLYDDARDYRARARMPLLRAPDGRQTVIRLLPRHSEIAVIESAARAH